jgi:hypothetical protein
VDFYQRTIDFSTDKAIAGFTVRIRQMSYRHRGPRAAGEPVGQLNSIESFPE